MSNSSPVSPEDLSLAQSGRTEDQSGHDAGDATMPPFADVAAMSNDSTASTTKPEPICIDLTDDDENNGNVAVATGDHTNLIQTSVKKEPADDQDTTAASDTVPDAEQEMEQPADLPDLLDHSLPELSASIEGIDDEFDQPGTEFDQPETGEIDAADTEAAMIAALAEFQGNLQNIRHEAYGDVSVPDWNEDAEAVDDSHQNADELDEEDREAIEAFEQLERQYRSKKRANTANTADDIAFERTSNEHKARKRRMDARNRYQDIEAEENSLFIPDTREAESRASSEEPARSRMPLFDDTDAAEAPPDKEAERQDPSGTRKGRKTVPSARKVPDSRISKKSPTINPASRGRGRGRGRGGRQGATSGRNMLENLIHNDTINQLRANEGKEAQPSFSSTTRQNAMKELIASIPKQERKLVSGDRKLLEDSIRKFSSQRAMKADGDGKWKLKGMQSSLHHYQTIGVAKMRQRESEGSPDGGILSDEMGFGKTVMAIANMVDGYPGKNIRGRGTLIVAPATLLLQWQSEIMKHTDGKILQKVFIYKSSWDKLVFNPVAALEDYDVVITSYSEVAKSMPKKLYPPHLTSNQAKDEWWKKHFDEHKLTLHRVRWHRVVLDEAHIIKNWESKTSEAAWLLRGRFRWALSGTPIQNRLEEFFGFWRFLKMADTSDYEIWKKNFCKRTSEISILRLQTMLEKIMIRRTHADQLFGRPILQLPPVKPLKTIEVRFSPIERAIYEIVKTRFLTKIEACKSTPNEKNYKVLIVLILRLRQLTGHVLLIEKTLKDLLESEDLERLWAIVKRSKQSNLNPNDNKVVEGLELALLNVQNTDLSRLSPGAREQIERTRATVERKGAELATNGLSATFKKYLESLQKDGQWAKANARSVCTYCERPPMNPHVTNCLHIYCYDCLTELSLETGTEINPTDDLICRGCGLPFKTAEAYKAQAFEEAQNSRDTPVSVRSGLGGGKGRRRYDPDDPDEDIDWFTLGGPIMQSSKTTAAVQQMEEWWKEDETSKVLIFSQFRGILKVFQRICREHGWGNECFHGAMNFSARNDAIERFTNDPRCKVLIAAMKAGGVGLNLTAANRIILIDLHWNIAGENQAFCRAIRIGQTRDVEIVRFAVKNTIDMEIVAMQNRKTKEIEQAVEKKHRTGNVSLEDLMRLFNPDPKDANGNPIFEGEDEPFIYPDDPYKTVISDGEQEDTNMRDVDDGERTNGGNGDGNGDNGGYAYAT